MLFDVTLRSMLEILEEKRIRFHFHKSDKILTLPQSNSTILFRSLDRYENLRGPNLAWVGVDELTYCRAEAWQRLEARVRDPRAKQPQMFAVWTPKGFDWVYKRFISPQDQMPDHEPILAHPHENFVILQRHPHFYEQLKSSYDELLYRQEALGEYLNIFNGRVYYAYSQDNDAPDLRFVPQEGLFWALDFNIDPMAAIIAQCIHGKIHVLEEIFLRNSNTIEMCERFEQRANVYLPLYQAANSGHPLPITVCGDATANARSTAASQSDYDLIRQKFRPHKQFGLKYNYPKENPRVKDRVNAVNAVLKSANKEIRVYVHPSCKELRTDFLEVSWKKGSNSDLDKATDRMRTHVSDAFGYLVCEVAPIDAFHRQNVYN